MYVHWSILYAMTHVAKKTLNHKLSQGKAPKTQQVDHLTTSEKRQ